VRLESGVEGTCVKRRDGEWASLNSGFGFSSQTVKRRVANGLHLSLGLG
jgi:hypothetical protein